MALIEPTYNHHNHLKLGVNVNNRQIVPISALNYPVNNSNQLKICRLHIWLNNRSLSFRGVSEEILGYEINVNLIETRPCLHG